MRKCVLSLFLLFAVLSAHAQTKFRFKNFTINDGLSQNSVTTILQDDLNSLWVGTQDGLNRYDGNSFEIFTSDKTKGLESEFILSSLKDKEGNLWFGTTKGLTFYDVTKQRFSTYFINKENKKQINDLIEDGKGNIWFSTTESGIFKFNKKTKTFKSYYSVFPVLKTNKIAITKKGELIISTEHEGVFILNTFQSKAEKINDTTLSKESVSVNTIKNIGNDYVLLGTNKGVLELNMINKKVKVKFDYLNRQYGYLNVSDIYHQDELGWLIATTDNGLFVVKNDGKVQHFTQDVFQKGALIFDELNTIFKDVSEVFWIGSQRGLSSFNPLSKGITGVGPSENPEKGIPSPSVWSFDESENYLYIGTDKAVSRLNKKTNTYRQFYRGKKNQSTGRGKQSILAINTITKNKLLIGCADGLYRLIITNNKYSFKRIITNELSNNRHNRIYSIKYWKENFYWIATKDGVVLFNEKTNETKEFNHDSKKVNNTIGKGVCRVVYKDLGGKIWFTTGSGGLNIYDEKLKIIHPYKFNRIIKKASSEYIASILQDSNGIYWFGTIGNGLIKWEEASKKATVYNKSNGLPNDVVYSVIEGANNTLWLSTNRGLCNLDHLNNSTKNYTEIDGLMSNEFNIGAYLKSEYGRIYFGGVYGYNYIEPTKLSSFKQDISVVFTQFKLENETSKENPLTKPIFLLNEVSLSYKQRSFSVKFQSSVINQPEILNYKYNLDGSGEGEILIGSQNEIHFNSLSHGKYTLKVYARTGEGAWSLTPAKLTIVIEPPFWFTWSFWAGLTLALVLLIRFFVKKRVADARRDQVFLEMKISERTREIKEQNKKIEQQKKRLEEERNKVVAQQKELQKEKDKTERLLKNVIPESTANELKKKGKARARAYKKVSVLFTDFVGFSKISDEMTATELVKKLDIYFTKFDEIIVKNSLEKIKTIGDAYMCAGGVPVRNSTNPIDTVTAALQIQAYMQKRKNDALANNRDYWELRLGINTGEVTAGVIGSERLAFDIWGATVNQAQRMEMLGQPGKVTITGATYIHIEPYFECRYAGKVESKNKELIEMYVVERIKPELSQKGEGIVPNSKFSEIVNLHHYSSINYYKAERHIIRVLEEQLSENLHYHSIKHTKDVVSAVERLALAENVTDEGLFLLKSAATYHDAGFVEKYDNNEDVGARMAEEILPLYGYTKTHIEKIKELIYVTEIPHKPKNKLEEIICDADLDYLGRDDFHIIAERLCRELIEHGKIQSEKQWDEIQVMFLTKHKFFTKTSKKIRNKKKAKNIEEVKKRLEKGNYK